MVRSGGIITADQLRETLQYDPETGQFRWLLSNGRAKQGKIAGTRHGTGYMQVSIDLHQYRGHRLAWLWMTGEWPPNEIDHIDGDRSNDRWSNLRLATSLQNKGNSAGRNRLKGASYDKVNCKWLAQIKENSKTINLGRYDCPAAAHFAYLIAAHKHFGEFARGK